MLLSALRYRKCVIVTTAERSSVITSLFLIAACCAPGLSLQTGQSPHNEILNKQLLLAAARAGGDYLVRMQKPDGSFHYYYNVAEDRFESRTYNIVRHAGTAWSLLDLFEETRDPRYLESARRAAQLLTTRFRPARKGLALYVLDYDGKAKLGASGLAVAALTRLLRFDPNRHTRAKAKRVADLIMILQKPDGSFKTRYKIKSSDPDGPESLYYPGEAMLGLVRLFELTHDRRLLLAARRGADYLVRTQRKMNSLPPDAWLMQALEALYNVRADKSYADHILALADSMLAVQYDAESPTGYAGGFGPGEPRVTPAASRAEGLLAAYRIARATRDARLSKIEASLKASAAFQLGFQIGGPFAKDVSIANPSRASGGFYEDASSPRIRIDFVQHNVSSLLGIAKSLY